ncbi:Thioredoxin, conserved site [Phytophthora cactorum]|nr:Thioredoxin, conserved site [Phytophthora cactorum]
MVDDLAELERLRASDASHEQQQAELQRQLDERDDRFAQLVLSTTRYEDELALLSLTGLVATIILHESEAFSRRFSSSPSSLCSKVKSIFRVAGLFDKINPSWYSFERKLATCVAFSFVELALIPRSLVKQGMDDSLYQHVKLEELVRLRLKAFEHEWQLAGGPTPSSSTLDPATDEGQDSAESSSCHLANVENFSALDALGLGGVGRLEREMRVLRSRNKRLIERTERLESELDSLKLDSATSKACVKKWSRWLVVSASRRNYVRRANRPTKSWARKLQLFGASVVQDALAIGNGARVKFDIPKLPQPESDADTKPGSLMLCGLLVTLAVLLPPNSALSSPRDRGPLFNGSVVVRSLDVKGYEAILADSESVWVVDYYSSWCAHCRMFAPKWEKVGEFYHESKVVQVGAVDCNQHKDVCQREEVHAYPSVKAHHVPLGRMKGEYGGERPGGADDDTSIQMKYKRLRDAGKAAMLALENSFFIGTPVLEGERYAAALKWVNALAATFPVEGNRVAVAKLVDRVKTQRSWPLAEWNELIEKWRPTARETSFPSDLFDSRGDEDSEWAVCETYTCGLWSLFHSMTTRDIKSGNAVEAWKPSDTVAAIRQYMQHFSVARMPPAFYGG